MLQVGTPSTTGEVPLTATVSKAGGLGTGAAVTAQLLGTADASGTVTLLDDGKNGDGAANDGVYGNRTSKLQPQGYVIGVRASLDGTTRIASSTVEIETVDRSVFLPTIRR